MSDETRDAARDRAREAAMKRWGYGDKAIPRDAFTDGFNAGFTAGADWASSRTCVWKWDVTARCFRSECDERWYRRKHGDFCQGCGAKITTEGR